MGRTYWRSGLLRTVVASAALSLALGACGDEPQIADATATAVDSTDTLGSASADGSGTGTDGESGGDEQAQGSESSRRPTDQEGTAVSILGPGDIGDDGSIRSEISDPGETQTFRIDVVEGQELTLVQLGGCALAGGDRLEAEIDGGGVSIRWLFRSEADGDCLDLRRIEITQTETLVIVIQAAAGSEAVTGSYSFQVVNVTTPEPVALDGDIVVSADSPVPGAGHIERIGYRDRYSFQAVADSTYVLSQLGCELSGGDFLIIEIEGAGLSDSVLLSGPTDCDRVDRLLPTESGLVELLVRANSDRTTGTYSFVVEARGADEAVASDLLLGDAANPAATPIISGELSAIGEQDEYSFEVKRGQQFVLQQTGECEIIGDDEIWSDVDGPGINDTITFKTLLDGDCRANEWYEADNDGRVQILIRHRDDSATGTYNFRLLLVPVDPILTLTSGQVVRQHSPVAGAGILSTIGQRDVYRMDVVDDEILTVELLGGCVFAGNDRIFMDIDGGGLSELLFLDEESEGDCRKTESFEIEETGPVFITVADRNDNLATGPYSFVVTID